VGGKRKKVVILDMWSSVATASGPSSHWLYDWLSGDFDVEVIGLPRRHLHEAALLSRAFRISRKAWADRYYRLKESAVKTPGSFRFRTSYYANRLNQLSYRPDLVFQLGGLFGPVGLPGIPYVSYHDQTVRMVESGWSDWLPEKFSSYREKFYQLEEDLFHGLDKIIAFSEATKQSFVRDYGIDNRVIDVIYSAVKLPYPAPEELYRPRKKQLLLVSTNYYLKGGDIAVAALPKVREKFPDFRLVIAGAKLPHDVQLKEGAVEFAGHLSMAELQRYYCESALLLHPARYDAFPNVVKEALVCGLPAIASSSCGIPEILDHGRAGVLLDELSPANLAHQVIELLQDHQRYRLLQERCLQVRDRFSPAVVGRQMVELFHTLMEPAEQMAVSSGGRVQPSRAAL